MIVEDLKKSFLQQAFEGKLTKTIPSDTEVSVTLDKIYKDKDNLINHYKVRNEPNYLPVEESEFLFKIPDTWKWLRIGQLGVFKKGPFGSALTKSMFVKEGTDTIKVYEQKNAIQKDIELGEYYITKDYYESKMKSFEVNTGDVLVSCAGTIGETFIVPEEHKKGIINQALMKMTMVNELNVHYFLLYFDYILKKISNKLSSGSAIKNIPPFEVFKQLVIPIPPIEEQERIVNILNQVFEKLDNIKPIEEELNALKLSFPNEFKYSIINDAIQGKLIINDERLSKCIDNNYDNPPYQIPDNWSWVKIDDVMEIQTGLGYKKTDQCSSTNGELRVLRGGNINNNYQYELKDDDVYVRNIDKYEKLHVGDILTPAVTSMEQMGKTAYIDIELENITAGGFVYIIRSKSPNILNPKYALYFINSKFHKEMCKPNIHKSGQAFFNLKKSGLVEQPIPIPPIEEQEKIVEKIEKILPLCSELENLVNE